MATPMEAFAAMQRKLREDSKTYESLSEGACDSAMTTTTTTTKEEEGNMNSNAIARQQAQQQQSENEMVLKELEILEDDAKVYKLIGPVLVKQDLVEARGNVEKRLDFIKAESDRLEKKAEEMQKRHGEAQKGIIELQQKMMALANPSADGA